MGIYSGYSKGTHGILKNAHTCAGSDHIKNVLRHVDCVVLSATGTGEHHCDILVGGGGADKAGCGTSLKEDAWLMCEAKYITM